MHKGTTGGSLGGMRKSPARLKREREARERQEKRWAAKAGDVQTREMTAEDIERFEARKGQGHRRV